jgi:hypothetical protein
MDHEERAKELEREADKLEQHTEHVGGEIEGVRRDWESKQQDQDVPGAQPHEALHPDEDEGEATEATQDEAPGVRDSHEDREVGE